MKKTKAEPTVSEKSGALRSNREGKGRFDLFPVHALKEVARVYQWGGEQKGDRNWEKGVPLSRFLDSALRHTFQVLEGQDDEPHAAQAIWNLLGFIQTRHWIDIGHLPAELDDLPKYPRPAP